MCILSAVVYIRVLHCIRTLANISTNSKSKVCAMCVLSAVVYIRVLHCIRTLANISTNSKSKVCGLTFQFFIDCFFVWYYYIINV
jgi:hypothetical protein